MNDVSMTRLSELSELLTDNMPEADEWATIDRDTLQALVDCLDAYAAHLKVCAGRWVPVGERLPVGPEPMNYRAVVQTALGAVYADTVQFHSGEWHFAMEQWEPGLVVTHWLDARLPGGEG